MKIPDGWKPLCTSHTSSCLQPPSGRQCRCRRHVSPGAISDVCKCNRFPWALGWLKMMAFLKYKDGDRCFRQPNPTLGYGAWRCSYFLTYPSPHVYRMENHLPVKLCKTWGNIFQNNTLENIIFLFYVLQIFCVNQVRVSIGLNWENICIVSHGFR